MSDHLKLINSNYFTIMLMLFRVNVYISTFNITKTVYELLDTLNVVQHIFVKLVTFTARELNKNYSDTLNVPSYSRGL